MTLSTRAALEHLLENADLAPERNCSCHISPPCTDCVEWGGLREAVENARAALKEPDEWPAPKLATESDLAAFLDGLHEQTDDGAVTNRKWEPAQRALAALEAGRSGEAVAWQTRWQQVEAEHRSREVGEWSDWCIWTDLELAERDHATNIAEGFPSEFRALYAATPQQPTGRSGEAEPDWLRGLRDEVRRSSMKQQFTLSRDEVGLLLKAWPWYPPFAAAPQQPADAVPDALLWKAIDEAKDPADFLQRAIALLQTPTHVAPKRAAPQQPPPVGVDPSKMLRGKVRPGGAFGIATIEVDCADLGPNTIGDGHEILIHNLTKNPISHQQPAPSVSEAKPQPRVGMVAHVDHGKHAVGAALALIEMGRNKPAPVSEPAYTKADDLLHTIGGVEHPDAASGEGLDDEAERWARDILDAELRAQGLHEDAWTVGCVAEVDPYTRAAINAVMEARRLTTTRKVAYFVDDAWGGYWQTTVDGKPYNFRVSLAGMKEVK